MSADLRPVASRSIGIAFSDSAAASPSSACRRSSRRRRRPRALAPRERHGAEHQRGVEVAVVVGGEDQRRGRLVELLGLAAQVVEAVDAEHLGSASPLHEQPHRSLGDHAAGDAGGGGAGPVGVVVGAERRRLGRHLDAARHVGARYGNADVAARRGHPTDGPLDLPAARAARRSAEAGVGRRAHFARRPSGSAGCGRG
jgi:hypothetical protein